MTNHGPVRIVVTEDKLGDVSDVQVMGKTVARAVVIELAEFDQDRAIASARENAILVVVEIAIAHRQIVPLLADAGTIHVGDGRPRELDILHGGVVGGNDPDALPPGVISRGIDHGTACADADDCQIARGPLANVA